MKGLFILLRINTGVFTKNSISENDIKRAISCGISKININTELQIAWYNSVSEFVHNNSCIYDPRKVIGSGEIAMKRVIRDKIDLFYNDLCCSCING